MLYYIYSDNSLVFLTYYSLSNKMLVLYANCLYILMISIKYQSLSNSHLKFRKLFNLFLNSLFSIFSFPESIPTTNSYFHFNTSFLTHLNSVHTFSYLIRIYLHIISIFFQS